MLCGLPTVQQAAIGDCLSFDPFSFDQNGLAPPEIDVSWRQMSSVSTYEVSRDPLIELIGWQHPVRNRRP